ncbi:MAG: ACP S-malonyltransferase [Verrucomicrobia bacterium]|nr:ACP S-malonyltransferase [Verrucomicrobiota bacterium]
MKTALLFAGQGAQVVGMGKDLAAASPAARQIFERANTILGCDLAQICFDGPVAELTKTDNAQPAIFAASIACMEALRAELGKQGRSLEFAATAGLSLGEFTAHVAAGTMSFDDGLKLVRLRGQAMQAACEATAGTMAAVMNLDEAACAEVCKESGAEVANLNCPGQIVISGEKTAIATACEKAKVRGAKRALPLNVAGAYHSRLMASAQAPLASALTSVAMAAPKVTVVSNVTAQPATTPEQIRDLLVRQVVSSVYWDASMRWLLAQGFQRFIELGPGTVLAGFMKRIDASVPVLSVNDCASLAAVAAKLLAP